MLILFAIGVVTGTILSFELGLLWPRFMEQWGEVFGFAFALEGVAFFIEAIFIAIYVYGWDRLSPRAHLMTGIPIVIAGVAGVDVRDLRQRLDEQPQGFDLDANGKVTDVRPLEALFNANLWHERSTCTSPGSWSRGSGRRRVRVRMAPRAARPVSPRRR